MTMMLHVRSVEEIQAIVQAHAGEAPLRAVAGRSKTALSGDAALNGCVALDVSALTGVIDYQPAECTFTARAATRLVEIEAMLAEHGQYLPFEPPFADRGATIGGTVAAALSGPGRLRYGGVRDFLLGVRFVDGHGRLIRGGGRVVKNAAGFYLQHLLLGSLGTLGVLTEVTCKVFPRAQATTTVAATCTSVAHAVNILAKLRRSPFELDAAELIPPDRLLLRVAGSGVALAVRIAKLSAWLQDTGASAQPIDADDAKRLWHESRELTWAPAEAPLIKIATTLSRLSALDEHLAAADNPPRRYAAGGDVAWLAWPHALATLDGMLASLAMPGLVVLAGERQPATPIETPRAEPQAVRPRSDEAAGPLLGPRPDEVFLQRVRQTLDPRGVFA
jgi:glycolate oxidase FAD binding subunit